MASALLNRLSSDPRARVLEDIERAKESGHTHESTRWLAVKHYAIRFGALTTAAAALSFRRLLLRVWDGDRYTEPHILGSLLLAAVVGISVGLFLYLMNPEAISEPPDQVLAEATSSKTLQRVTLSLIADAADAVGPQNNIFLELRTSEGIQLESLFAGASAPSTRHGGDFVKLGHLYKRENEGGEVLLEAPFVTYVPSDLPESVVQSLEIWGAAPAQSMTYSLKPASAGLDGSDKSGTDVVLEGITLSMAKPKDVQMGTYAGHIETHFDAAGALMQCTTEADGTSKSQSLQEPSGKVLLQEQSTVGWIRIFLLCSLTALATLMFRRSLFAVDALAMESVLFNSPTVPAAVRISGLHALAILVIPAHMILTIVAMALSSAATFSLALAHLVYQPTGAAACLVCGRAGETLKPR